MFEWDNREIPAFMKTKLTGTALKFFTELSKTRKAESMDKLHHIFSNFFKSDTKQVSGNKWKK